MTFLYGFPSLRMLPRLSWENGVNVNGSSLYPLALPPVWLLTLLLNLFWLRCIRLPIELRVYFSSSFSLISLTFLGGEYWSADVYGESSMDYLCAGVFVSISPALSLPNLFSRPTVFVVIGDTIIWWSASCNC